jgi:hypothetical protein
LPDRRLPIATPNAARHQVVANPATACKALVAAGAGGYTSFGGCVSRIRQDVANFRFFDEDVGALLSLDQRCAGFEAEG